MCLLVVVWRLDPGAPLVVGANRDERLDRPASATTVLRASSPRILGGRDEVAGGTWLAVNEHGVVAGLTNRPAREGRDPSKRSRGELPLALASQRSAASAVDDFVTSERPADYNPAWLLVADRTDAFAIDMTGGDAPLATTLGPGLHVLENNPFGSASPKVEQVRALLGDAPERGGEELRARLASVLADHHVPADDSGRRPETLAACVHADDYGTRSSTLVVVPADAAARPVVEVADGHPCTTAFVDVSALWTR
ncbi:MAG: NRDE family protein [Acidimicrobiales bacterium]|jgi:uncharacterized protein with NRDE domain